ncbi:MAG TPA: HAMP domain-containing sensor histidine kinase, partial [Methylomirabilota bacterium]|nr:HAMP domain-containing sensor histidine kinase [Methylomirabilota bacterium]
MRLSLFSRLVIGYLAVFTLVMAVSLYALLKLHQFDEITQLILEADHPVLDYEKKLADSLLSEIRYERKFIISKDEALYREFLQFKADFDRFLGEVLAKADPHAAAVFNQVKQDHEYYQELFSKETVKLRTRQAYSQTWYKNEKDKAADHILEVLDRLKTDTQQDTYRKVRKLADAGAQARQAAVVITIASLAFILVISFVITRSITKPIAVLKNKTREIAQGRFNGDLQVSSPPEIRELAAAFNLMCQKLNELEKMKADFFASMSHELRTPLTSIKEGTGLLLEGVGGATTDKQQRLLTIVAEESSRLISLVNSLLDLSKMEAGMMTYNFEKTSLAPLINKALVEITPLVEAKEIKLETEIPEGLPALKVDRERVLQALRNLIGNAVKFTPKAGRVTVGAR